MCRGDRFVIRDASAQRTLGGGTVLDVTPIGAAARRGRRAPARLQLLTALRDDAPADALRAWLDRQPVQLARLASSWNLRDDEARKLVDATGAHVAAGVAVSAEQWQRLRSEIIAAIGLAHQREPEMPGVEQQRLRRMIAPALDVDVFASVVDELLKQSSCSGAAHFSRCPRTQQSWRKTSACAGNVSSRFCTIASSNRRACATSRARPALPKSKYVTC